MKDIRKGDYMKISDQLYQHYIYNQMIHDMANDLTTDYHGQSWVINFYFQQAKKKVDCELINSKNYRKERKTMKVMISQPMSGVPDEKVKRIQKELKDRFAKYHIEVVDSFINDDADDKMINPSLHYLGRTIQKYLSDVDAVYFVEGWQTARGCRIEREICHEYGIMILDETFFKQENEIQVKREFGPDIMRHIPQLETNFEMEE